MNEQNRYRGNGSQQRQNPNQHGGSARRDESASAHLDRGNYADRSPRFSNEWDRDYGHRQAQSDAFNPEYERFQEPSRGRSFGAQPASAGDNRAGQENQPFRESDGDYRGNSSGYVSPRGRQQDWNEGRSSGYGDDSYGRDYGSSELRGRTELPWGVRGDSFSENRGPGGPVYGRSHNENSIANFGTRTRQDANFSGPQSTFYGRGPKGYARSDERIREDVCERLSENDEVDASDVEVSVKDREVTLTGTVETRRMKHIAEDIADSISGVQDVHNRISVRKALLKDIADRIMGDESSEHHAHSGTKTTTPSTLSTPVANGR